MLLNLIRRLHILAGLLVFSQFVVFGLAGLVASLQPTLERPKIPQSTQNIPFTRLPAETDKQVATRVYQQLKPAMSRPVPDWAIRKNPEGHLLLDFYSINGIVRVAVEPTQLHVENIRNSTSLFLEDIHAATLNDTGASPLVRLWAYWNELGIWALLFFAITGTLLWIATRARDRWPWALLAASTVIFIAFWGVFRWE